jgi:hypothetical protein
MSHCTRFDFAYRDEAIAVRAFRHLGLRPETTVISSYASEVAKRVLGGLGLAGRDVSRAICAERAPYTYMLIRKDDYWELIIESGDAQALADVTRVARIEADFRLSYVKVSIEQSLGRQLDDAGVPWRLEVDSNTLTVSFGPDFGRLVVFRVSNRGIEEEVSGILGPSCERLTAELEEMLMAPTAELLTEWKPAYHEMIEDEIVQVLRLST